MKSITLIATKHKELGMCNADELCELISNINPEVVFLEALVDTYSDYQQVLFKDFDIYHSKLEIAALQN